MTPSTTHNPKQRRDRQVNIALTEEEKARLTRAASAIGLDLSTFVRMSALGKAGGKKK